MSLLTIHINEDGDHWDKKIYFLGFLIYHRHDYTKENGSTMKIGFNSRQYCTGEIWDE